jgi:hypothetical protein
MYYSDRPKTGHPTSGNWTGTISEYEVIKSPNVDILNLNVFIIETLHLFCRKKQVRDAN